MNYLPLELQDLVWHFTGTSRAFLHQRLYDRWSYYMARCYASLQRESTLLHQEFIP